MGQLLVIFSCRTRWTAFRDFYGLSAHGVPALPNTAPSQLPARPGATHGPNAVYRLSSFARVRIKTRPPVHRVSGSADRSPRLSRPVRSDRYVCRVPFVPLRMRCRGGWPTMPRQISRDRLARTKSGDPLRFDKGQQCGIALQLFSSRDHSVKRLPIFLLLLTSPIPVGNKSVIVAPVVRNPKLLARSAA